MIKMKMLKIAMRKLRKIMLIIHHPTWEKENMNLQRLLNNQYIKSSKKIHLKTSISPNKIKLLFSDKNKNLQKMNSKLQKKKFMMIKKMMKMMKTKIMINKMIIMTQVTELMTMAIKMRKTKKNKKRNFYKKLLINREKKKSRDLKMKSWKKIKKNRLKKLLMLKLREKNLKQNKKLHRLKRKKKKNFSRNLKNKKSC